MSFKDWTDVAGNLSQVLLICVGGLVYWQIKIAKDDLKIRCQRDSRLLSMDLAKEFAKEIIPAINGFHLKLKTKNFTFQRVPFENFYSEEVKNLGSKEQIIFQANLDFLKSNRDLLDENITILNLFEAFAMNFMKELADEEVVFSALGGVYCMYVEESFLYLCTVRKQTGFNPFENTVSLYKIWSKKIKKHGMSQQQKSLTEQLKEIDKEKKLIPLGTK
jgi:hypothetical protein